MGSRRNQSRCACWFRIIASCSTHLVLEQGASAAQALAPALGLAHVEEMLHREKFRKQTSIIQALGGVCVLLYTLHIIDHKALCCHRMLVLKESRSGARGLGVLHHDPGKL